MDQNLPKKIHLTDGEIKAILNKLVPVCSPQHGLVQHLVLAIIDLNREFCLSSYLSNVSLSCLDALTDKPTYNLDLDILTNRDCEQIAKTVVKHKKSDEWAVSYMLVLFYQAYGRLSVENDAWLFMSSYLQVMFMIASRADEHFAKINRLGVRVRMGLKTRNPQSKILDTLIETHATHTKLKDVLASLHEYEHVTQENEQTGQQHNNNLAVKVGQIRLAYEVVAENKTFISKDRSSSNTQSQLKQTSKSKQSLKRFLTTTDEPLQSKVFAIEHRHDNVAFEENLADDDPPALLDNDFKPSRTTAKSSELQRWALRSNYRHASRNQFNFPTNTRQLSLLSYQMLFARVWSLFLIVACEEQKIYAVIILSLLSGRSIQEISDQLEQEKSARSWLTYEKSVKTSNSYVLSITINVTDNRRSHLLQHRQSRDNEFKLPLPDALKTVVEESFNINPADVKKLFKSLKKQLNLPSLSSQHIDVGLYTIINNALNQPLHADIITGVDVRHSSPLYYTSISTHSLEDTYSKAIHFMTEYCDNQEQNKLRHLTKQGIISNQLKQYVGSNMVLNTKTCQMFFTKLTNSAQSFNGRLKRGLTIQQDRYIEQFNAYGVWLWHIIIIQTGIRPAVHAPGMLNQIDFNQKLLWVSDKEERNSQSCGRLIPLSNFLIIAILNYLDYLKQFAAIHNVIYPNYPFPIDDILSSRQPLIMLFSKNPKGFDGISASKVRYQLKDFLTHQDNWLRHQLRTMLTDKVPEHLICGLYGHELPEQESMHPMSSLSINQLKALSSYLDDIAVKLKLQQVKVDLYG